jgi:hypothetical protein
MTFKTWRAIDFFWFTFTSIKYKQSFSVKDNINRVLGRWRNCKAQNKRYWGWEMTRMS